MTETQNDKHLDREWEQAWSHYRHLESTRSQYLGFFFTVLVASVGLAIGLAKDVKPDDERNVIVGLTVLAFVVFLITIALFIAIKKTGYVLRRYEIIINTVRRKSGFESSKEFPFNLADMKDYPRDVLDAGLFSVQRSVELTLGAVSWGIVALLVWLAIFFVRSSILFEGWQKLLGLCIAACATSYLLAVFGPLATAACRRAAQDQQTPPTGVGERLVALVLHVLFPAASRQAGQDQQTPQKDAGNADGEKSVQRLN